MNITLGRSRFTLQKKVMVFLGVVPLLLATALIQLPCPICNGDGEVSSTGMDEVTLATDPAFRVISTWLITCNTYRVYQVEVTLDLENNGPDDANGFVSLFLIDIASNKTMDAQNIIVSCKSHTKVSQTVLAHFGVAVVDDPQQAIHIHAVIRSGNVPCEACDGSGRVALNTWPYYNAIRDTFKQSQIIETPLLPPLRVDTEMGTD